MKASRIDGANKFQNAWYITIPSILPVICINLILSLSGILNAGFDQIFNMYSAVVYEVADIIDTYVYRLGLANMQYSLSTAVGLFKSVVGLIFILAVNSIIRRLGGRENSRMVSRSIPRRKRMIRNAGELAFDIFNVVLMFLIIIITLYPFWFTIVCSFSKVVRGKTGLPSGLNNFLPPPILCFLTTI